MSQAYLLASRRFMPLFVTQFCGAFNDNLFKNALTVLVGFQAADQLALPASILVPLSLALFILPFFLFSATSGQLADKYDKAMLTRQVKLAEIILMVIACVGFLINSLLLLFITLFLLGLQATVFGPIKYSILPQHLGSDELLAGNGLIEMGTFLAILLGTIGGGWLIGIPDHGRWLICCALLVLAVSGWIASLRIPSAPSADPDLRINWNAWSETFEVMRFARQNHRVFLAIVAISWFWFIGALYLSQLLDFSKTLMHGTPMVYILFLTFFSVGVGSGSIACEKLSHLIPKIRLGMIGGIGLSLFSMDMMLASHLFTNLGFTATTPAHFLDSLPGWHLLLAILLVGFFGGLYIVPLYAYIQQNSPLQTLARIISANNILNALFMVAASVLVMLITLSAPQLFFLIGLTNLGVLWILLRHAKRL